MEKNFKACFYESLAKGGVVCLLCPHECKIPDGDAGLCGVRRNLKGELFAESYGLVTSLALDPMEKKPLYMFYPGSMILSVGFFGCNLFCPFCQNHTIAHPSVKPSSRFVSPMELVELAGGAVRQGNVGVAFTYNEPLVSYEYVLESAKKLKEAGLKTILVTNGFINPAPFLELLPYVDALNIDLKGMDFYIKLGGSSAAVMDIVSLAAGKTHVEVTCLVVPGENEADVEPISKWLASLDPSIPLHLTRFFPRYKYSDRKPTPAETVLKLAEIAKKHLENVFAGNISQLLLP